MAQTGLGIISPIALVIGILLLVVGFRFYVPVLVGFGFLSLALAGYYYLLYHVIGE